MRGHLSRLIDGQLNVGLDLERLYYWVSVFACENW